MDDIGYVRLSEVSGTDLTVVNAARVSFERESNNFCEGDKKLIFYLAKHNHTSPFRHASLGFQIYAPLFVSRQWFKHCIGSEYIEKSPAWNESSRRYITAEAEFYIPKDWRLGALNIKQGSSNEIHSESSKLTQMFKEHVENSKKLYNQAIEMGICVEQARLFYPAYSLYVKFVWTASLQAVFHFTKLRTDPSAQKEIRDYALEVERVFKEHFPVSWEALTLHQK